MTNVEFIYVDDSDANIDQTVTWSCALDAVPREGETVVIESEGYSSNLRVLSVRHRIRGVVGREESVALEELLRAFSENKGPATEESLSANLHPVKEYPAAEHLVWIRVDYVD